jgi:ubiquinone/menaquinone biosynthesis C-methylase UbiE
MLSSGVTHHSAYEGYRHYSRAFLSIYDLLVLRVYGPLVWRCPTDRLVRHYARHLGRRHVDVGPGTGYFLEHANIATGSTILLIDPNPNVLRHAARRLARLRPAVLQADVLEPLPGVSEQYDSVALNYVLHCMPGPMPRRGTAIRNLAAVLEPDGTLFGATVLGTPTLHTWLSRAALRQNNRLGFFDNLVDTEEQLRELLAETFVTVEIEIVGSVAVFAARGGSEK